jgi:aminoglycoside 3-N-acetyltransferase
MPVTTSESMEAHLRAIGLCEGMDVMVHSKLISFGLIEGGVATVYEALRRVVGDGGTIGVPTYTHDLGPEDVYDPAETACRKVGLLSEYVRTLPGAVRSRCPLHGHAMVGPKADLMNRPSGRVSMGPGSDFDVYHQAGFHLLYLGCPFHEAGTFIFHVQAMVGISYREWRDLPRRVMQADGTVVEIGCRYYVRVGGAVDSMALIPPLLERQGVLSRQPCPLVGESFLLSCQDFFQVWADEFSRDPRALLVDEVCGCACG